MTEAQTNTRAGTRQRTYRADQTTATGNTAIVARNVAQNLSRISHRTARTKLLRYDDERKFYPGTAKAVPSS